MEAFFQTELEKIRDLVHMDDLAEDVSWCLDRLPELYYEFSLTYEARYLNEVRRLVDAVLMRVPDTTGEAVIEQLCLMHERLGLPSLDFVSSTRKVACAVPESESAGRAELATTPLVAI